MRIVVALVLLSAVLARTVHAQPVSLPNQRTTDPLVPRSSATTPPSGDTVGYWQQRADYTVRAVLDEARGVLRANGTLHYVNASPDTLHELWLHQHLNAFRPGSRWSAMDAAQGKVRFQALKDPDHAFERFTAPPTIGAGTLTVEYPLAPDSTVVRLGLPRALLPGDSVDVQLAWEARPSTVLRRQGRKGRQFDFAQWYPKVAVYDRHGWKPNAFVPQGELYGEFGTFDVTFVLPVDQVIASTGVPLAGDPGWERVAITGNVPPRPRGVTANDRPSNSEPVPDGYRAVRFVAERVHHFGWSVSPDFRYEGGEWVRPRGDTVALHVLHRNWMPGRTLAHMRTALAWLEERFGPYGWPQFTIVQRLEQSGTEFPMLVMNGEEDLDLVVHEAGHQFTYGMLANNEWQSAWMDEGLTSYSELWRAGWSRAALAAERQAANRPAADLAAADYVARFSRMESDTRDAELPARAKRPQPLGLRSDGFEDKNMYDVAVYTRGAAMYGALRDVMGNEPFERFLREYFRRWRFRHVDRWAMQRVAEDVTGRPLGWFFGQWIDSAGVVDYRLSEARVSPSTVDGRAMWTVTVQLQRLGVYRHPMPVGVRTAAGWTIVRADPAMDRQTLTVTVSERPDAVWLDPFGHVESSTAWQSRLAIPTP